MELLFDYETYVEENEESTSSSETMITFEVSDLEYSDNEQ